MIGASFRNAGQITALAGCDLLTISPELLAQLAASEAPLARALDAEAARKLDLPAVQYDEAQFRLALNQDAMATEKLAEGIRSFIADAEKLSVSDTELDADLKRRARSMGVAFGELKSQLVKNDRLDGIREELRIDKALELLLTEAVAAS